MLTSNLFFNSPDIMAQRKFYVVWEGLQPGIYHAGEDCKAHVDGD